MLIEIKSKHYPERVQRRFVTGLGSLNLDRGLEYPVDIGDSVREVFTRDRPVFRTVEAADETVIRTASIGNSDDSDSTTFNVFWNFPVLPHSRPESWLRYRDP